MINNCAHKIHQNCCQWANSFKWNDAKSSGKHWRTEEAESVVVREGLKTLIGRILFDPLGILVTETLNPKVENMVNNINTMSI